MINWLKAYFIVPFSPRAYWPKSGLDSGTERNWDDVVMLFILTMGGFLGLTYLSMELVDEERWGLDHRS